MSGNQIHDIRFIMVVFLFAVFSNKSIHFSDMSLNISLTTSCSVCFFIHCIPFFVNMVVTTGQFRGLI